MSNMSRELMAKVFRSFKLWPDECFVVFFCLFDPYCLTLEMKPWKPVALKGVYFPHCDHFQLNTNIWSNNSTRLFTEKSKTTRNKWGSEMKLLLKFRTDWKKKLFSLICRSLLKTEQRKWRRLHLIQTCWEEMFSLLFLHLCWNQKSVCVSRWFRGRVKKSKTLTWNLNLPIKMRFTHIWWQFLFCEQNDVSSDVYFITLESEWTQPESSTLLMTSPLTLSLAVFTVCRTSDVQEKILMEHDYNQLINQYQLLFFGQDMN